MSESGSPKSFAGKFWRMCLYLFGGVVLLTMTIELVKQIWWIFVIAGIVIAAVIVLRWWHRSRNRLD